MLTFLNSAWICLYRVPTLNGFDWKENEVTFKKETSEGIYGQWTFANACFRLTKKPRFRIVMVQGEEGVAAVWFEKVLILLQLRSGRAAENREALFWQYMEVTAPFDVVEKNLSCICVRCSTSYETDRSFFVIKLKHRVLKGRELYGLDILSSVMGSSHRLRSKSAVHFFTTELLGFHHRFSVDRFYVDSTFQTHTEADDCNG